MPLQLFYSYCWDDKSAVDAFKQKLDAAGFAGWIDKERLTAGVELRADIVTALDECKVVLAFVSPAYLGSASCKTELSLTKRWGKRLIPIVLPGLPTDPCTDRVTWPPRPSAGAFAAHMAEPLDGLLYTKIDAPPEDTVEALRAMGVVGSRVLAASHAGTPRGLLDSILCVPWEKVELLPSAVAPEELGRGAFARVLRGRHEGRDVAVKELLPLVLTEQWRAANTNEELLALSSAMSPMVGLMREAELMLRYNHAHVMQVYCFVLDVAGAKRLGRSPIALLCEVMRMDAQKYLSHLAATAQLSLQVRIRLASDIARGLRFLHERHVTHGDAKLENVLVDAQGRCKLGDFGLARLRHAAASSASAQSTGGASARAAQGTPTHMAPELFSPLPESPTVFPRPTPRSDVYAFGVLLWRLCAVPGADLGMPAWLPPSDAVRAGWRPAVTAPPMEPDTPRELLDLMATCWLADPAARPDMRTVSALLQQCERLYPLEEDWAPSWAGAPAEAGGEDAADGLPFAALRQRLAAGGLSLDALIAMLTVNRDSLVAARLILAAKEAEFAAQDAVAVGAGDEGGGRGGGAGGAGSVPESAPPLGSSPPGLPLTPPLSPGTSALRRIPWAELTPASETSVLQGDMAAVFRAMWARSGNVAISVAVKVIKCGSFTGNAAEIIASEAARIAAAADGGNEFVVQLYGACGGPPPPAWLTAMGARAAQLLSPEGACAALVMRWEDGGSLHELLHSPTRSWGAGTADRLQMCAQIASGLASLHNGGGGMLIHGDLRPENVLLSHLAGRTGGEMRPRICDFGFAKLREVESSSSVSSSTMHSQDKRGTWPYMAPEMYRSRAAPAAKASCTSDVYALATLCWEVLSGARPWEGFGEADRLADLRDGGGLSLDAPPLPIDTPVAVKALLAACLSADRAARPRAARVAEVLHQEALNMASGKFDVYLSHAWGEEGRHAPLTTEVYLRLLDAGLRVWLDTEEMGANPVESIQRGIAASGCVVALLSERYGARPNCLRELEFARALGKPIVGCLADAAKGWFPTTSRALRELVPPTTHLYADLRAAAGVEWAPASGEVPAEQRELLTKAPSALPRVLRSVREALALAELEEEAGASAGRPEIKRGP